MARKKGTKNLKYGWIFTFGIGTAKIRKPFRSIYDIQKEYPEFNVNKDKAYRMANNYYDTRPKCKFDYAIEKLQNKMTLEEANEYLQDSRA